VGRDGTTTVTVRLHGGPPPGTGEVGSARVLVDDGTEALPVPLLVTTAAK
jgi:hypothetical protein